MISKGWHITSPYHITLNPSASTVPRQCVLLCLNSSNEEQNGSIARSKCIEHCPSTSSLPTWWKGLSREMERWQGIMGESTVVKGLVVRRHEKLCQLGGRALQERWRDGRLLCEIVMLLWKGLLWGRVRDCANMMKGLVERDMDVAGHRGR